MHEEIEMIDTSGVRLCNTISLLIPAYSYHINCAWTQQIPCLRSRNSRAGF